MAVSEEFKNRLNELIDEAEIKRTEITKKIGYPLSNALNYGIVPTPRVLISIADFFGVSINYLLGNSDDVFEKSSSPSDFYARFRALCEEKGISAYRVAADCHFDKSCISKWISKKHLPSLVIAELLCDYFDVSIDYLFGRTDYKN